MERVLVTGMSGTGKSTSLARLAALGHRVVDTDWPGWSEDVPLHDGSVTERLWIEDRMQALLAGRSEETLFVSGCTANQWKFYDRFDAIVLLTAPIEVILDRVATRDNNPYGKSRTERAQIIENTDVVEPLLRRSATDEIDTTRAPEEVVEMLAAIARRRHA